MEKPVSYRVYQFLSLMLGARIFVLIFITFALYVSNFFLINIDKDIMSLFLDYKIHGIILCSVLSIAAGSIINQFYDKEKDKAIMPFTSYLQSFLKQKHFLYIYLFLNALSITIALFLSFRIFIFFLCYQFLIWFYSHKMSRILLLNNLTYVLLSLYPFFGFLIYYQSFSLLIFWMSLFLFLLMLSIDILKDVMTKDIDRSLGYQTFSTKYGDKIARYIVVLILGVNSWISYSVIKQSNYEISNWRYFEASIWFFIMMILGLLFLEKSKMNWISMLLKFWVLVGLIFMLFNRC